MTIVEVKIFCLEAQDKLAFQIKTSTLMLWNSN